MSKNKITVTGKISNNLQIQIIEKEEYKQFIADGKGKDIAIEMTVSRGSKFGLIGYYKSAIIPKFKKAFADQGIPLTADGTCYKLREIAELYTVNGNQKRLKEIEELNKSEFFDFIDFLKLTGAEYFNIYIDDPINQRT